MILKAEPEIYIRFNQIGFLPEDFKTAIILSTYNLDGKQIFVINTKNGEKIFSALLQNNLGAYGDFPYTYSIDFSIIKTPGEYFIQYSRQKTFAFRINDGIYNGLADTLLQFFKVQRCGYTDPLLHKVCHIADASGLIYGGNVNNKIVDVTGGWHDAGDYVKFLNTTAFATYMLLFSYEFDPVKFSSDKNNNNIPDILEEAKVGLDWMLRCYYEETKLITQVQNLRDHDVGWRMPEDDPLGFDRPAFTGIGKNLIGIYSATMALASRIWMDKINYPDFANKCLAAAENLYALKNKVPDIDSSGTGMYLDKTFIGKLSLGAVELYLTTKKTSYLEEAAAYADSAKSDYWWSWGDVNSLADFKLGKIIPRFGNYIKNNLDEFNKNKKKNLFGKGTDLTWGTNVTLLGISLQNILYKKLTGDKSYDSLETYQRDFILGRNAWGISFISGIGNNYTKNFHHQISYIKKKLPGGFAAGPVPKEILDKYKIIIEKKDKYYKFQTNESVYHDDRLDYITNEPTITGNATAIFVFGNLMR
jgi:hypothetical protein